MRSELALGELARHILDRALLIGQIELVGHKQPLKFLPVSTRETMRGMVEGTPRNGAMRRPLPPAAARLPVAERRVLTPSSG